MSTSRRRRPNTTTLGDKKEQDELGDHNEQYHQNHQPHKSDVAVASNSNVAPIWTRADSATTTIVPRIVIPKRALVLFTMAVLSHLLVAAAVWWLAVSLANQTRSLKGDNGMQQGPTDIVIYMNRISNNLHPERKLAEAQLLHRWHEEQPRTLTPVPAKYRKTFYYDGTRISNPVARAFRSRGWRQVDSWNETQIVYTFHNNKKWAGQLQKWQRFNYVPGHVAWNHKYDFAWHYKRWERLTGQTPLFLPETYMIGDNIEDVIAFQQALEESGGDKYPWVLKQSNVNQGRGIRVIAPHSDELYNISKLALPQLDISSKKKKDTGKPRNSNNRYKSSDGNVVIQKYVCNEMTWGGRKFDVRMFWFVASLDPLIVLYHDGYIRIGNANYSEQDFSDTKSHLTTCSGRGAESEASFTDFQEVVDAAYLRNLNIDKESKTGGRRT